MKKIVFYYDIVCPFAYMASRLIEGLARRTRAEIQWKPVLLGGLYKGTTGDGDSSVYEQMADAKKLIQIQDLRRMMYRNGIDVHFPSQHPRKTLNTMRLLAAAATEHQDTCVNLTHWLYKAYWVHDRDVTSMDILKEGASSVGWSVDVEQAVSGVGRQMLLDNTQEALDRGAFGVPGFWVNDKLYFGHDRMHIVESVLGPNDDVPMQRVCQPPSHPTKAKLTIYHDFASPWSYLGSTQISKLIASVHPVSVEVEWVPILVGALFTAIGTPMVPMQSVSKAKRIYALQDFDYFCNHHRVPYKFTSHFPLRTILPARVSIVDGDDRLRQVIYEAGWRYEKDIGNEQVLREVLTEAGFDTDRLIAGTKKQEIKDQLKANTDRAIAAGLCGVPSYQVNNGPVIWGQDRLNVVADTLCGWKDITEQDHTTIQSQTSKL